MFNLMKNESFIVIVVLLQRGYSSVSVLGRYDADISGCPSVSL